MAGCGYKTDPVLPRKWFHEPIDDLSYSVDETGVTLSWTYPEKTVNGEN